MRRKLFGRFHWNLSRRLHDSGAVQARGPYFMGRRPADRVLLLAPSVNLSATANEQEMKMIVMGLMQVSGKQARSAVRWMGAGHRAQYNVVCSTHAWRSGWL